jgi:hypothetical protein
LKGPDCEQGFDRRRAISGGIAARQIRSHALGNHHVEIVYARGFTAARIGTLRAVRRRELVEQRAYGALRLPVLSERIGH